MAAIQITIEFEDLQLLMKERDDLKKRVAELEARPLEFSLPKLARDVRQLLRACYTPDQYAEIRDLIESGGKCNAR